MLRTHGKPASWAWDRQRTPLADYLANLPHDGAELELRALVVQRTGEDWRGVELTLSTADPQSWAELPDLPSLKIGRRQPPPRSPSPTCRSAVLSARFASALSTTS